MVKLNYAFYNATKEERAHAFRLWLKNYIESNNMTQLQAAVKMDVVPGTVNHILNKRRIPSLDLMEKMTQSVGVHYKDALDPYLITPPEQIERPEGYGGPPWSDEFIEDIKKTADENLLRYIEPKDADFEDLSEMEEYTEKTKALLRGPKKKLLCMLIDELMPAPTESSSARIDSYTEGPLKIKISPELFVDYVKYLAEASKNGSVWARDFSREWLNKQVGSGLKLKGGPNVNGRAINARYRALEDICKYLPKNVCDYRTVSLSVVMAAAVSPLARKDGKTFFDLNHLLDIAKSFTKEIENDQFVELHQRWTKDGEKLEDFLKNKKEND